MRPSLAATFALSLLACSGGGETDAESSAEALASHAFANPLLGATAEKDTTQCPDPNVRQFGSNYFMVCTHDAGGQADAFPVRWSSDLVHWKFIDYAFTPSSYPSWANPPGGGADYWAPELYRTGGKWLLVFAATRKGTNSMAIGVATADAIAGPWTATSEPLVRAGDGSVANETADHESGRIDASLLTDPDTGDLFHDPATGDLFLYYIYQPRWVRMTRLASDGLSVVRGHDQQLMLADGDELTGTLPWEKTAPGASGNYVVEGVEAHHVDGQVILLYSGAGTWNGSYAVGAARASSPEGPFTKRTEPILQTRPGGKLVGPGHSSQWIKGPNGDPYILYHTQFRGLEGNSGPRVLNLGKVSFDAQGWPVVGDGYASEDALALP